MNELLKVFLSLSLSGTLLILALFLCKTLYRNKLSRQWQYYIWLIVIVRLLIPFAPETNLVGNIFQKIDNVSIQTEANPQYEQNGTILPETDLAQDYKPTGGNTELTEAEQQPKSEIQPERSKIQPKQNVPSMVLQYVWVVWLMGAIALLIRKITVYQSFVKYIKAGRVEISDIAIWERFGKLVEQSGVKRTVGIYTNSLISSPLLIGFFRPCIILPSAELSDSDFQYTILHELTHYKRMDMFYKWLVQITICLHWFNPFVYLMGREINRACELSCDEAIIRKLDANSQRAYGDTLLNALGIGGNYKDSLASVTLTESKELLKERLDSIMKFKKQTQFGTVISIALAVALCLGAAATGAYAATTPISPKDVVANQTPQPSASVTKPPVIGNLTLVEKEYTMDDIKSLNISGLVVEALSENVSIIRGGKTLKIQYYVLGQNDYILQKEFDGGGTRENLCLLRKTPLGMDEAVRSISITIPDEANFKVVSAHTISGNITIENCTASLLMGAETKSGQVFINGCSATGTGFLNIVTDSGNTLIAETALGDGLYRSNFDTQTGTISFQPKDSAQNYCLVVYTGADAQITVNGKKYAGGDYEINDDASKRIYFDSPNGSLIVQDLSMGELSLAAPAPQSSPAVTTAQPKPAVNSNLTQVKKEYTASDLQSMNITGLRVNALADDVVLTQGGTSLILEYSQAYSDEYSLQTKEYQLYMDGYGPASQGNMPGTIEQLVISRTSEAASSEARRTIYITLPADSKLNRVVKVFTDSGNITADKCSSTAMFDLTTKTGNIKATQCSSPFIGADSKSGKIELSNCKMDELGMITVSGAVTLQLADKAVNYKMTIDTGTESQITVNGKTYQGGEFTLNKNAINIIQFDSKNGSLVVNDN